MTSDPVQYAYDRDGNLLYEDNLGPSTATAGAPSATAAAFSQLYHVNSTTSGDDNTAYDALGRLTAMRRGTLSASTNNGGVLDTVTTLNSTTGVTGNSKSWSLNAVGGWTSVTTDGTAASHTTNAQNETTAVGSTSTTYGNNGNLTKNDQGYTLKYDAWDRIVSTTDGSGYTFTYDALGRLMLYKITGSNTNTFFYDNQNQLIEEYVSGTYSQFVFGMAYVNEVILRDSIGTGTSNFGIASSGLHTREYDQQDANWNTTSLYETAGSGSGIIERLIYDPYGTPKTLTNAWASFTDTSIFWRFLFQGAYWLAETNTYIMGARNFDYTIGSWDQKDPIGYGDGMNDYQGFRSNPVSNTDPLGEAPKDKWYGYTDRNFQGWYHRFWKGKGDQDATQEDLEEAYDEWEATGKPDKDGHRTEDDDGSNRNSENGSRPVSLNSSPSPLSLPPLSLNGPIDEPVSLNHPPPGFEWTPATDFLPPPHTHVSDELPSSPEVCPRLPHIHMSPSNTNNAGTAGVVTIIIIIIILAPVGA